MHIMMLIDYTLGYVEMKAGRPAKVVKDSDSA